MSAIDRARASLQALMRDSGTLRRPSVTTDAGGAAVIGTPTDTAIAACNFQRLTGRELELSSQLQQRGSYRLALPVATDIRATDQFIYQGVTYNVVWAPPLTAMSLSRVVGLEESGALYTPPVVDTGWSLDFSRPTNSGYLGAI